MLQAIFVTKEAEILLGSVHLDIIVKLLSFYLISVKLELLLKLLGKMLEETVIPQHRAIGLLLEVPMMSDILANQETIAKRDRFSQIKRDVLPELIEKPLVPQHRVTAQLAP